MFKFKSLTTIIFIILLCATGQGLFATQSSLLDLKFTGDLRLRYQSEDKADSISRQRYRIRFRLGGRHLINPYTNLFFGLATGSSDPRSTNETLDNSFESSDIRLDYAFVKHEFCSNYSFLGGKIKNPLWRPSDLLWDSDIRPEGMAIHFSSVNAMKPYKLIAAYFVLDENKKSHDDPFVFAFQSIINHDFTALIKSRFALSYYHSKHLKDSVLSGKSFSNDFSAFVLSFTSDFERIYPYAEYVLNTKLGQNNMGYITGLKFGDKKVNQNGKWQCAFSYRYLEKNAWLATLPDSDAYGGDTNIKGLELLFAYGLSKTTKIGIDFYQTDVISGTKNKENLLQVDLGYKF
eukprot:COSAG01_NODE_52_length_31456_cov_125.226648_32_plen_348_part_00